MEQKEREAENFQKWESQEDTFHLEQAKLRSRIRIKDGRAKPIDLLARYALSTQEEEGAEDFADLHEPYTYLNGLTTKDLENLLEDIQVGVLCWVFSKSIKIEFYWYFNTSFKKVAWLMFVYIIKGNGHEDKFAQKVNFAQRVIFARDWKISKIKYYKKQKKKLLT